MPRYAPILPSHRLDATPALAGSGLAGIRLVCPPQKQGQQRQNNHHHKPGSEQRLLALREAMVPVVRFVGHFAHHLANRRAWHAVLFEQEREQRREGK